MICCGARVLMLFPQKLACYYSVRERAPPGTLAIDVLEYVYVAYAIIITAQMCAVWKPGDYPDISGTNTVA